MYVGQSDIFDTLSNILKEVKGDRPREKIVHVVEKLHCRAHGETGIAIRCLDRHCGKPISNMW